MVFGENEAPRGGEEGEGGCLVANAAEEIIWATTYNRFPHPFWNSLPIKLKYKTRARNFRPVPIDYARLITDTCREFLVKKKYRGRMRMEKKRIDAEHRENYLFLVLSN